MFSLSYCTRKVSRSEFSTKLFKITLIFWLQFDFRCWILTDVWMKTSICRSSDIKTLEMFFFACASAVLNTFWYGTIAASHCIKESSLQSLTCMLCYSLFRTHQGKKTISSPPTTRKMTNIQNFVPLYIVCMYCIWTHLLYMTLHSTSICRRWCDERERAQKSRISPTCVCACICVLSVPFKLFHIHTAITAAAAAQKSDVVV